MTTDKQALANEIVDLLELINRAENAITRQKEAENPSELLIKQYQDLRQEYLLQLLNLINSQLQAGERTYAMAA
jgi:hypothetical protein